LLLCLRTQFCIHVYPDWGTGKQCRGSVHTEVSSNKRLNPHRGFPVQLEDSSLEVHSHGGRELEDGELEDGKLEDGKLGDGELVVWKLEDGELGTGN
jgi:hypothetical protein